MNILFCGEKNITAGIFLSALSICKNTSATLSFYILTASIENHTAIPQSFAEKLEIAVTRKNSSNRVILLNISDIFGNYLPTANMKRIRYYKSFIISYLHSRNYFSFFYCKFFLHMKIRGRKNLKAITEGFFIYGNHTQPVGDVFIPALCVLPIRIYTVVSTANYGIPLISKILVFLGALPITESFRGIKELNKAIEYRLKKGDPIVIYPEAHVWEYYTDIRPFPDTSFKFSVKFNKPAFAMTATYKKSKLFKRPIMEVFLDGPFYPEGDTIKEKTADLHSKIYTTMKIRSENSDFQYIEYKPLNNKCFINKTEPSH